MSVQLLPNFVICLESRYDLFGHMDPVTSPLEQRQAIAVTSEHPSTRPRLREAIQAIQEFQFDPGDHTEETGVEDSAALIMFPSRPSAKLPTLRTET